MKKILLSAAVAALLGTPALAQSYDPDLGTGNLVNQNVIQQPAAMHAYAAAPRHTVRQVAPQPAPAPAQRYQID